MQSESGFDINEYSGAWERDGYTSGEEDRWCLVLRSQPKEWGGCLPPFAVCHTSRAATGQLDARYRS